MKFIVALLFLLSFSVQAQEEIIMDGHEFLKLKEGIYISKKEVSKKEYEVFLLMEGRKMHTAIYDSGWVQGEDFQKSYFEAIYVTASYSDKYDRHPVVNIFQAGAMAYCDWLTDKYSRTDYAYKMNFRLPTEKEWRLAEKRYKNKDIEYERIAGVPLKRDKEFEKFNINPDNIPPELFEPDSELMKYLNSDRYVNRFTLWPIDYYDEEGEVEIYHLLGNVSEWTAEKDLAIGGNWMSKSKSKMDATLESKSYSPLIGFRVLMEIQKD